MDTQYILLTALCLPLAGFLTLLFSSQKISRGLTGIISCSTIGAAFALFVVLALKYKAGGFEPLSFTYFSWIPVPGIDADFALHLDALSFVMCFVITGIGCLIHIYANGYMDHEKDYARFFAELNFFVFAMLLLVLAANLPLLFVGWEGVGLASYLLIGFDYHRPSAAAAAIKAMVVNRVGDLGFLLGLFLIFITFQTGDMVSIVAAVPAHAAETCTLTAITLLLFWGACGKSAQLPLYTWLPDAMEGPTPVSALIHAATMVTAGIYMIVRLNPLFTACPETMHVIAIVGAATSVFAALSALSQSDLKRVLAYSTVSQLGLMFLACGVGAYYAAMFHLITHAFIKALLFLTAGNVLHMTHEQDMSRMGGLKEKLPQSHILFAIGVLAMAGLPPLAAFFSKDLILHAAHEEGLHVLYAMGCLTSLMTAFYLTRALCLTFYGKPADAKALSHVHEAPLLMNAPLFVLATGAVAGGLVLGLGGPSCLAGYLEHFGLSAEGTSLVFNSWPTYLAIAIALVGVGAAFVIYTRPSRVVDCVMLLKRAFYVDELYELLFVVPTRLLSWAATKAVEPLIFAESIDLVREGAKSSSRLFLEFQSGQLRSYAALMLVASAFFLAYLAI